MSHPATQEKPASVATDESCLVAEEAAETHKVPEINAAVVDKKPVRGRRAKLAESLPPEDTVTEPSEIPVVAPTVRGRRGTKAAAVAPPAVRQTKRGRNARCEEEAAVVSEAVSGDQPVVEADQEKEEPVALPKEAVTRPTRGRKNKTQAKSPLPQQEESSDVSAESTKEDVPPQLSVPAPARSRRGRQAATAGVEQTEAAEATAAATVESEQPPEPPVRAKRGRNAKQAEDKTAENQEPLKKSRRTRKAEEDQIEQKDDQMVEAAVPDQTEAPETVKEPEVVTASTKPKRGGRKPKPTPESETPVEATNVEEVTAAARKIRQGGRAKRATEEAEVTAVVPERANCEPEVPETPTEPEAPASKTNRGRQTKKAVSAVPNKRARRGATPSESQSDAEAVHQVFEVPVEPPKRGRRAAAKPTAENPVVVTDQVTPSKDSKVSTVEGEKIRRGIQWKAEVEVFEIPAETPVKAVRGRRPRAASQAVSDSQDDAEAQPAKRAKRGSKISDGAADKDDSTCKKSEEPEPQPKTRRGRSAKK